MSTLTSVTRIIVAAAIVYVAVSRIREREHREKRADSFNQAYWDGRLACMMEDILTYENLPVRKFYGDDRDSTKRRIECNEFRSRARKAYLNKSEREFERIERDLTKANFFV